MTCNRRPPCLLPGGKATHALPLPLDFVDADRRSLKVAHWRQLPLSHEHDRGSTLEAVLAVKRSCRLEEHAVDRFKGVVNHGIAGELRAQFPNGLPTTGKLQSIVDGLTQEELAAKVSSALGRVDQNKLNDFGAMVSGYATKHGIDVPPGVERGNPRAMGAMLAGLAKSEKGINGALRFLQLAAGGRGVAGAAMALSPLGRGGLIGLLSNPKMRSVIGPVISGLVKR